MIDFCKHVSFQQSINTDIISTICQEIVTFMFKEQQNSVFDSFESREELSTLVNSISSRSRELFKQLCIINPNFMASCLENYLFTAFLTTDNMEPFSKPFMVIFDTIICSLSTDADPLRIHLIGFYEKILQLHFTVELKNYLTIKMIDSFEKHWNNMPKLILPTIEKLFGLVLVVDLKTSSAAASVITKLGRVCFQILTPYSEVVKNHVMSLLAHPSLSQGVGDHLAEFLIAFM